MWYNHRQETVRVSVDGDATVHLITEITQLMRNARHRGLYPTASSLSTQGDLLDILLHVKEAMTENESLQQEIALLKQENQALKSPQVKEQEIRSSVFEASDPTPQAYIEPYY